MNHKHTNEPSELEDNLINYYQSQQISNDRLNSIIEESQARNSNRYLSMALAACVALISAFTFIHLNNLGAQRTQVVLREVALNHASKLQMDAEAKSLPELQTGLHELPFDIKLPEDKFFQQLALVGGRYCTINGNLAAHIKLADPKTAKQYSLFLTPYAENLKSMDSPQVEMSGVDVKLWREQEFVYAFAKLAGNNS